MLDREELLEPPWGPLDPLSWGAEAQEAADWADALFARCCPPERVRAIGSAGADARRQLRSLWTECVGLGIVGAVRSAPGAGGGPDRRVAAALLMAAGRGVVPLPLVETLAVWPVVGACLPSTAVDRAGGGADLESAMIGVVTDGLVAYGDAVDLVLRRREPAHWGLVTAGREPAPVVALDPTRCVVRLRDTDDATTWVDVGPRVDGAAVRAAQWGSAATLTGLAQEMLRRTVAHVRQRRSFGGTLADLQAVRHLLADCEVQVNAADACVLAAVVDESAAVSSASTATACRAAATARLVAEEALRLVTDAALQLHGAVGLTEELDLSLWLRRGTAAARAQLLRRVRREDVLPRIGRGRDTSLTQRERNTNDREEDCQG